MVRQRPTSSATSSRRVALVHEWLASSAGSEQTFERMALNFPAAELVALSVEPTFHALSGDRGVKTTPIQHFKWLREHRGVALPLMPLAWRLVRELDVDILVTSSHAFSRYVRSSAPIQLSYVYTPMRYAWTPSIDSRGAGWFAAPARASLRWLDRCSTRRVDGFAGISTEVVNRIGRFYGRSARLIFPPVDTARFSPPQSFEKRSDYLFGVSRWIPYKKLDLVIELGEALRIPVKIAGRGPEGERLKHLARAARVPVDIVESPSDAELADLFRFARLVVFPPYEDFGIVPVESQASGTPVVGFARGGTVDTVVDGVTGALASEQTLASFVTASRKALALGDVTENAVRQASRFTPEVFDNAFVGWVNEHAERLAAS